MSDGADEGIGAERALKTILGGDPPPGPEEQESVEAMRARILAAPLDPHGSYDGCATACARIVLEALERWPVLTSVPTETIYLRDDDNKAVLVTSAGEIVSDFSADVHMVPISSSLYDVLKRIHPEGTTQHAVFEELTGFMWGWAVNAARRCAQVGVKLGPVPNPALLDD